MNNFDNFVYNIVRKCIVLLQVDAPKTTTSRLRFRLAGKFTTTGRGKGGKSSLGLVHGHSTNTVNTVEDTDYSSNDPTTTAALHGCVEVNTTQFSNEVDGEEVGFFKTNLNNMNDVCIKYYMYIIYVPKQKPAVLYICYYRINCNQI